MSNRKATQPVIARFAGAHIGRELTPEEIHDVGGGNSRLTLTAQYTTNDWGPSTIDGSQLSND